MTQTKLDAHLERLHKLQAELEVELERVFPRLWNSTGATLGFHRH